VRDRSLNGGQTQPLKPGSLAILEELAVKPLPRAEVNHGVVDRLTREPCPLAEVVDLPSPYKRDRGGTCRHLQITEAGREVLRAR
jgi:hypothetical protein